MACCIPAPPSEHLSEGKEEVWEGIDVYVNEPSPAPTKAVVLIADVFGWKTPLLRSLADKVAAAGYLVLVPDLLYGDPYTVSPEITIQSWLPNHMPDGKPLEDATKLVEILHSRNISRVGVTGFCWGAKVIVVLAQGTLVASAATCHPSFLKVEDVKAVKQPLAILAAETDYITPVEVVMEMKAVLEQENKESFVKVYPGTSHGWTVRYDTNDETAVKNAQEAHEDILNWFKKTL